MKLDSLALKSLVKKIEISPEEAVILLDTTEDSSILKSLGMKNIFCINENKEVIWQISLLNTLNDYLRNTFVYMKLSSTGVIIANTFFGMIYSIDPETGLAKKVGWNK